MSIELLYIIPLVALSFFALIILLNIQRKTENKEKEREESALVKEVEAFNIGSQAPTGTPRELPGSHLNEIEKTISLVSKMLSNQQKVIEGVQGVNVNYSKEVDKLKRRLRELQKEYDIVLSENYSLHARLNKLKGKTGENHSEISQEFQIHETDSGTPPHTTNQANDAALLGDTQSLEELNLDDTAVIDISDLKDLQ